MKSVYARCGRLFAAICLCLFTACGGASASAQLQIQFSPSMPSVAANSSIQIDATTTPTLPKYLGQADWSIAGESSECLQAPPSSACPNGTLEWNIPETGYAQLIVTYYAPSTPGIYQVSLQSEIIDSSNPNKIDYQGTVSVSVTVTAP